jgi:hypothetical protein
MLVKQEGKETMVRKAQEKAPVYLTYISLLMNNESMDLNEEHKKDIERKIMETIISSLESGKLNVEEYDRLAPFILERIEVVKTHDDLLLFLRDLTHQWPIFSFILTIENGEVRRFEDQAKVQEIQQQMVQEGVRAEESYAVAKDLSQVSDQQ